MDDARPEPNTIALLVLLGSSGLASSLAPVDAWRALHEPSTRAGVLMLVVIAAMIASRRRGAAGTRNEYRLLCVFSSCSAS
jgi:hypothetical protein